MRTQTSVRVEECFYEDSKKVFASMGITFSDAVNIFLAKISQEGAFPFPLEVPSKELQSRVNNVNADRNMQEFDGVDEFFASLKDA